MSDETLKVQGEVRETIGTAVETAVATDNIAVGTTTGTATGTAEIPDEVKRLVDKINSGNIGIVSGALGDMENCEGFVERIIEPLDGGRFTKFFGCTFLFKGYPIKQIVEGIGFSKAFFSMLPRKILAKSRYWKTALFIRYLFARKYFWHDLHIIFFTIYINIVMKAGLPHFKLNKPTKALKNAIDRALNECANFQEKNQYSIDLRHGDIHVVNKKREIWETLALAAEFIYLFIEYDNAYRFRIQDAFETLKKDRLKGFGAVWTIAKLFDIMIEREDEMHGIRSKWRELKKIIIPILIIDANLRKFIRTFLNKLDIQDISLDKDDWYFCLKRMSYNFRGIPLKERLAERKRVDKKMGHKYYRLVELRDAKGGIQKGIQVIT